MSKSSYLIVGLGNPGKKYYKTRHNLGARVLETLIKRLNVSNMKKKFESEFFQFKTDDLKLYMIFPLTYMNLSGSAVLKASKFYNIPVENIIIIHDDVDLDYGKIKIKESGGAGGHNGLKSIINIMGSREFMRVRLGIGRPTFKMESYVLGLFSKDEQCELVDFIDRSTDALEAILNKGVQYAMNTFNGS
jgi:peptidyl-tRNA hydrolase, PTH1 family